MSDLNPRFVYASFCDDVRQELGGKISIMGMYHGNMNVNAVSTPTVLPRVCVVVTAVTPVDDPFQKLDIKILYGEDVLYRENVPADHLNQAMPETDAFSYRTVGAIVYLQPFEIPRDDVLRVRVETERGEIRVAGLEVKLVHPEASVA